MASILYTLAVLGLGVCLAYVLGEIGYLLGRRGIR
jgi:hypothetical protein